METSVVNQTQFTPLSEALCKCVNELNIRQIKATFEVIVKRLRIDFPNMELPAEDILKNSLKSLVQNKKLFYDKQNDCFLCFQFKHKIHNSFEDFESLSLKNQQLLTCEEAFTRLNGKSTHYGSEESSTSKKSWAQVDIIGDYQRKRDSLVSTGNSSTFTHKTNPYLDSNRQTPIHTNHSLRRSSSLRLESNKMINNSNDSRNTTFKRSRSFKLNRRKHELFEPQESSVSTTSTSESTTDSCKCKVESNRKQSVLSKFLRLGNTSNISKSKSLPLKSSNFSAQFPETNSAVIPYNKLTETKSTATQTVKCGPEDYATVIIKQASRHALAKSGSHKSSTDYHKNSRCRCLDREFNNTKHTRANKSLNKSRNENKLELNTTPISAIPAIGPITTISAISTPINGCLLCECNPNPEIHNKMNSNRNDLTNNNNYWSKPHQQMFRQLSAMNGSHKYDYNLRQSEGSSHNSADQRTTTTSPLSYIRSATFSEQRATDETPGDRGKGYQTARTALSPQTTRLNNSLIERTKDNNKPKTKTQTQSFNTCLDSHKVSENRFTQNLSSIERQSHNENSDNFNHINNSNNTICVDSEVNVKIEIGSIGSTNGSTNTSKLDENNYKTLNDSVTQSHQNSTKIVSSANIHTSNAITRVGTASDPQTEPSNKHPVLTSATTVTTTMTLPNVYSNSNKFNCNSNAYNRSTDWVQSPTDAANVLKSLKLCSEDNNNRFNKQNNLLSEIKINSIPHLSPIRQKVAKAKAEFFNSTGPQTTTTPVVTNLLIEK